MNAPLRQLLFVVLVVVGCNQRTSESDIIFYAPTDDAGAETSPEAGTDGPECAGPEGATCELEQALGVCLGDACRLVACASGFIDCDGDVTNGCETATDGSPDCGVCGLACDDAERCQFGEQGYECASEVICPPESFDLDIDPENGCEWRSSWSNGRSLSPVGYTPALVFAGLDGESWSAGLGADGVRLVGPLGSEAIPVAGDPTSDLPVDVLVDDDVLVVWPDQISRIDAGDQTNDSLRSECTNDARFVGLTNHFVVPLVATEHHVQAWRSRKDCTDCEVFGNRFRPEDYLRAFWPGSATSPFGDDEVAGCVPCSFDPATGTETGDPECHPDACRPDGPPLDCTCDVSGCPEFDVVQVLATENSDLVFVVTSRGLVVLRLALDFEPVLRLEERYVPGATPGRAFVDATLVEDGGEFVVSILDNGGRLIAIRLDDHGLVDVDPAISVGAGETLLQASDARLTVADDILLVGSVGPSASIAAITEEGGPGIAGLEFEVAGVVGDSFLLLYSVQGLTFERTLERQ